MPHRRLSDLSEVLASMQGQLNTLAAIVHSASDRDNTAAYQGQPEYDVDEAPSTTSLDYPPDAVLKTNTQAKSPRRKAQRFLGPTSPAYSFHAAKKTLKAGSPPSSTHSTTWPPRPETHASDRDDTSESSDDEGQLEPPHSLQGSLPKLLKFRDVHLFRDTKRLLAIYQHVIGDFHPIVPLESLSHCAERCYAPSSNPTRARITSSDKDQYDVMVLNLALAIALCAEPGPGPRLGGTIMSDCREGSSVRLVYRESSVSSMVISLMTVGFHVSGSFLVANAA